MAAFIKKNGTRKRSVHYVECYKKDKIYNKIKFIKIILSVQNCTETITNNSIKLALQIVTAGSVSHLLNLQHKLMLCYHRL